MSVYIYIYIYIYMLPLGLLRGVGEGDPGQVSVPRAEDLSYEELAMLAETRLAQIA